MKKFLSVALAFLMLAVMLPVTAMAEENVVNVTTANATTINYGATSNVTYKFAAGNYGTLQAFLRSSENVTFIAEDGATFDRLEIGYHAGQDGSLANKTNSTLTVQGFKVTGDLFINAADQKVIVQNNTAGNITIKTHHIDNMDIQVLNNEITGGETAFKYGIYIVPNTTNYDLTITGNKLSNIKSHAIGVQGCGDGSAVTAAKSVTVSNNNFISYGVGGDFNRAAFKIWNDTKLAPEGSEVANDAAVALANSIANGNTFSKDLGENCKVALFDKASLLDPPTPPEEEGPSTIVIITPSEDTTPKTEPEKNPTTGANDVVAAAVALMAVSALGAAVLTRKK